MKPKAFDAVRFMRTTRDRLSKKYKENPDSQERDLIAIRKKYGKLIHAATAGKRKIGRSASK